MKIRLMFVLSTLFVVLLPLPGLAESPASEGLDYPPIGVPMELKKVTDRVYYVQGAAGIATDNEGFISNAGFVVTGEGVVVFDALGSPSLAVELLKKIRSVTDQPVTSVVVSHYHADHIYGLQVFKALGAQILAPAGALAYLDSPAAEQRLEERRFSLDPWVNDKTSLVRPDRIIAQDTSFRLGEVDFHLSLLGAVHSDGDMSMFVEPDRVLFSGDIIFEGRIPFVGDADTRRWVQALDDLQTGGVTALIPGHGPAAADPDQALAQTRDYLHYLRQTMGEAVAEMQDFAEAYEAVDWSAYQGLPAFDGANRRNAYQVYLSLEREEMAQE